MWHLIRAEWIKTSRRPMAWVLLIGFLAQLALFLSLLFLVVALHEGTFTDGQASITVVSEEQIEQYRLQLQFPGVFGEVLGQINGLGGIFAVILAAGVLGSEYQWGTLRVQLARYPDRGRYLTAKVLALLGALLVGIVLSLAVGVGLALLYGGALGSFGSVTPSDLLLLPLGIGRSLYVMLPYVLLTIAIAAIGRSVMAGVAGGILFTVVDASAGAPSLLAAVDNPIATTITSFLVQQNVNTLVMLNRESYGLDPLTHAGLDASHLPSPLQATIVIGIYSIVFFGYAHYWLRRHDITGAA